MSGRRGGDVPASDYLCSPGGSCWLVRVLVALDRATELASTDDTQLPTDVRAHLWAAAAAYQRAVSALEGDG